MTNEQPVVAPIKQKNKSTTKSEEKALDSKTLALFLAIFAFLFSGTGLALTLIDHFNGGEAIVTPPSSDSGGNSASFIKEGSISEVTGKVADSVVSITTEVRTTSWFGQSSTGTAAGTGIIVSSDGYILTNKHVISGANKISVVTADGKTYDGVKLIATDPLNDIAFLKISDVSNLHPATLGDSKTITVGQEVLAIGNALGQFDNTVTTGIISGTGRSIVATDSNGSNAESLSDLIQTDAAINAGNSGGPLVNAAGEVIGINTATSSNADGIGFAIPISSVKGMLNQLLETGEAKRAYLGVYSINITPEIATEYDLPVTSGAYLYYQTSKYNSSAIASNSPAAKAHLKDKDIVISVQGTKIGTSGSLTTLIGEYKPGDTIQLTVLRAGEEKAFNVTLEEYKDSK